MTMAGTWRTTRAAFSNERATRRARPPRTPFAVRLGRAAARVLPRFAVLRRAALVTSGFGALDYAAWSLNHIAGYAAIGVSLLLLDALSGGDQ